MRSSNAVHNDTLRRQAIAKENLVLDRQGWVDRDGALPTLPMPGQGIRLRGLTRRADLNGCEGHVLGRPADERGRVTVRLEGSGPEGPRDFRVSPAWLERSVGCSPSAPALPPAEPPEAAVTSDVSSVAPNLTRSGVSASAPSLPALLQTPTSPAALMCKGFSSSVAFDVHKFSGQGRGYLRKPGGGFFAQ